jgi:hypothetical protein
MKKESQVARAIKLLEAEPNISAQDMATKLSMPIKRVYVLRNNAKKHMAKGATKLSPKPHIPRTKTTISLSALQAENLKLTEWTLLWRQKYEKLEQDYTQAKIMFLNSEAVVKYLEERIEKLMRN